MELRVGHAPGEEVGEEEFQAHPDDRSGQGQRAAPEAAKRMGEEEKLQRRIKGQTEVEEDGDGVGKAAEDRDRVDQPVERRDVGAQAGDQADARDVATILRPAQGPQQRSEGEPRDGKQIESQEARGDRQAGERGGGERWHSRYLSGIRRGFYRPRATRQPTSRIAASISSGPT